MRSLTPRRIRWVPLCYMAATALFVWLIANLPVVAAPRADADDALFVRGASHLLNGEWLGPYDRLTLVKGPFYAMWIAFTWLLGVPLLVSQGLAYAFASLALVRGLTPWLRSEAAAFALFTALLLNPATYSLGMLRVLREGIYVPLCILLFALVVWWIRWREERLAKRFALATAFGVTLACYWCTREEGPWLVPALLVGLAVPFVLSLRAVPGTFRQRLAAMRASLLREVAVTAVGFAAAIAVVGTVAFMNVRHYGVSEIVEVKQRQFVAAYGALAKVGDPGRDRLNIVISREGLRRLYEVSPAAAELRPYLEGPTAQDFVQAGCDHRKIMPCDGEFRSELFFWVFRDAAAAAGHYASGVDARRFYARLASEINTACDENRIACTGQRFAMPPPFQSFRTAYVAPAVDAFQRAITFAATFDGMAPPREIFSCTVDDCGRSEAWPFFLQMVGANQFIPIPWLPFPDDLTRRDAADMPAVRRYQQVLPVLDGLTRFYSKAMPIMLGLGLACFLGAGLACFARHRLEPLVVAAGIAGAITLCRLALIAYLDATSLPAINSTYLSPAYPALIVFSLVSIAALGEALFDIGAHTHRVRRQVTPAE